MKNILFLIVLIISVSCKAQQVYPLNTDFDEIPQNSYLKDINNELNTYVGTYKANFQNKEIILYINKIEKKYFDMSSIKIYKDVLSIKFVVKNSSGNILQDTQNMNFQTNQVQHTIYSLGTRTLDNIVGLSYGGTNCSVGNGLIYLKKINATQISWEYLPNDIILDDSRCPPGTDITIYLPETKDLIFTKQ